MSTFKWANSPSTSGLGAALNSTELNSLANNGFSAVSAAFDNTSNLNQWFWFEVILASLNPTAGAYVNIYAVPSLDLTNYADAPSSTNPGNHLLVATLSITTGSAAKRQATVEAVKLPPGKWKFVVKNGCGVAFASSGNSINIYSSNDSVA